MGVRPTLNMRAGLTFVREKVVWRTEPCKRSQNCRTRAKSRKTFWCFFLTFFKKVLQKRPSRPVISQKVHGGKGWVRGLRGTLREGVFGGGFKGLL